jgi:hypothetical protein
MTLETSTIVSCLYQLQRLYPDDGSEIAFGPTSYPGSFHYALRGSYISLDFGVRQAVFCVRLYVRTLTPAVIGVTKFLSLCIDPYMFGSKYM